MSVFRLGVRYGLIDIEFNTDLSSDDGIGTDESTNITEEPDWSNQNKHDTESYKNTKNAFVKQWCWGT